MSLNDCFKLCSILGLSEPTTFGTFSGKDVPSQIASNGHIMRLEFQSDHSNTGKGFNISYTSTFLTSHLSIVLSDFVSVHLIFQWNSKHCHGSYPDLLFSFLCYSDDISMMSFTRKPLLNLRSQRIKSLSRQELLL